MKPKNQRLAFVVVSMFFLLASAMLTMRAFRDNLVFFYSPSELASHPVSSGQLIRIGGLVEEGTFQRGRENITMFSVTDGGESVGVVYEGALPPLFREGQGIVAEGHLEAAGTFRAKRVLTKHDENYMPREVVDALKASGRWRENE